MESARNVRAADLQEQMVKRHLCATELQLPSVSPAPTKTAATNEHPPRAERAIRHRERSEQLDTASGASN
jgi:hypothetical protein